MKKFNEQNLSTAIALGTCVCCELGICCDQRGRIIFQIYNKLEELKDNEPETSPEEDSNSENVEV